MRRLLPVILVLTACGGSSSTGSDDASLPGDDATGGSGEADHEPPHLSGISPEPGSSAWLHEPIRFTFDEPIVAPALTVTATLGGEPIEVTTSVDPDRHALVIKLAPTVRVLGPLEIAIEGKVADRAGNLSTDDLAVSYSIDAWSAPHFDHGPASGAAAVAVSSRGDSIAAWLVGANCSPMVK